jgi:hypothetical protein
MTGYLLGRDAAYAGNIGTWDGTVLGYYGGPDAYHTWAAGDWDQYPANPKIPIWVAGYAGEDEGKAARDALRDLGVPKGCVTVLDMELRVDRTYVAAFGKVLQDAGYKVWPYGVVSTVFRNPQLNGYAVADVTGVEHMYPHPAVRMTQYAFGSLYDDDAVKEWLLAQDDLWV